MGELLAGWLIADFLTGVFHWWEDQFGKESWPLIGSWLIAPNRLHHVEPLAFTRNNFWQRTGASVVFAGIIGAGWCYLVGPSVILLAAVAGGALATEVHRLAHEPRKAGPIFKVLQEIGLIQSPKGHARHHRPPQDRNFCILTDWLNPIFEALNMWTRMERMIRK